MKAEVLRTENGGKSSLSSPFCLCFFFDFALSVMSMGANRSFSSRRKDFFFDFLITLKLPLISLAFLFLVSIDVLPSFFSFFRAPQARQKKRSPHAIGRAARRGREALRALLLFRFAAFACVIACPSPSPARLRLRARCRRGGGQCFLSSDHPARAGVLPARCAPRRQGPDIVVIGDATPLLLSRRQSGLRALLRARHQGRDALPDRGQESGLQRGARSVFFF